MTEHKAILTMSGISKRFGATQALDDVSLALYPGEIHALVGENGAGKSTLIKIMTGIYAPDAGVMAIDGEEVSPKNSAEAQRLGIAAMYQEPLIFPDLTVGENIFIGHNDRGAIVDWKAVYRDAQEVLDSLELDLDAHMPAVALTVAAQQGIEIAKALSLETRVLIMDEPTAALTVHEADRLFQQVGRLRDAGIAVLFISHRLEEVFGIADRVTVFRDGHSVSARPIDEVTEDGLIREMVGRDPAALFARSQRVAGEELLRVESLGREGAFADISFEVARGEILGFAGLVGAGRTDVALALFGISPADRGQILIDGERVKIETPSQALEHGIAYLSEDRRLRGLSMPQSVGSNITLAALNRYTSRLGLLDQSLERKDATVMVEKLGIRTPSLMVPVAQLSGGNQQKTMLAKWLNTSPRILILDEPTRGIDVGAKADVHRHIDDLAQAGMAIIMISSDLPEVLAMSDRVLVMREGLSRGVFDAVDSTQESIMTAAVGAS